MRHSLVRALRGVMVLVIVPVGVCATAGGLPWTTARIAWRPGDGVTLETPVATVSLDRCGERLGPVLHFLDKGLRRQLSAPKVEQADGQNLVLRYQAAGPDNGLIEVLRRISLINREGEAELTEIFTVTPAKTIRTDLEIERPFSVGRVRETHQDEPVRFTHPMQAILPLYNGWARTFPLASEPLRGEWHLGNVMRDVPSHQLGLPVVQIGEQGCWLGAVCADPYFGSLYEFSTRDGQIRGAVRYRYAASKVPLLAGRGESRHFGFWLAAAKKDEPFGRSVDAFFRLMLPDVPPGPNGCTRSPWWASIS